MTASSFLPLRIYHKSSFIKLNSTNLLAFDKALNRSFFADTVQLKSSSSALLDAPVVYCKKVNRAALTERKQNNELLNYKVCNYINIVFIEYICE